MGNEAEKPRALGLKATLERRAQHQGATVEALIASDETKLRSLSEFEIDCLDPWEVEHFFAGTLANERVEHVRNCALCTGLIDVARPKGEPPYDPVWEGIMTGAVADEPVAAEAERHGAVELLLGVLAVVGPFALGAIGFVAWIFWEALTDRGLWVLLEMALVRSLVTTAFYGTLAIAAGVLLYPIALRWFANDRSDRLVVAGIVAGGGSYGRVVASSVTGSGSYGLVVAGAIIGSGFAIVCCVFVAKVAWNLNANYAALTVAEDKIIRMVGERQRSSSAKALWSKEPRLQVHTVLPVNGRGMRINGSSATLVAEKMNESVNLFLAGSRSVSLGTILEGKLEQDRDGTARIKTDTGTVLVDPQGGPVNGIENGQAVAALVPPNGEKASKVVSLALVP